MSAGAAQGAALLRAEASRLREDSRGKNGGDRREEAAPAGAPRGQAVALKAAAGLSRRQVTSFSGQESHIGKIFPASNSLISSRPARWQFWHLYDPEIRHVSPLFHVRDEFTGSSSNERRGVTASPLASQCRERGPTSSPSSPPSSWRLSSSSEWPLTSFRILKGSAPASDAIVFRSLPASLMSPGSPRSSLRLASTTRAIPVDDRRIFFVASIALLIAECQ